MMNRPPQELDLLSPAQKRNLLEQLLRQRTTSPRQIPISYNQQPLWFFEQYAPGNPAYHLPVELHFSGQLDPNILEQSLNELMQRHEALRTALVQAGPLPEQVIFPHLPLHLPATDLQAYPEAERQAKLHDFVRQSLQHPFDLTRAPLWRARLFYLAPGEQVLLIILHHMIADNWSVQVLVRELVALYEAFYHGQVNPLPPVATQYSDFTLWQQTWLQGDRLQIMLQYWQQQLTGDLPQLNLPLDHPRTTPARSQSATVAAELSADLTEVVRHLSQRQGTTSFTLLLTVFMLLLQQRTQQTDLLVGVPVANRHQAEFESVIGFVANAVVIRTDLSGCPRFRELLQQVRNVTIAAYRHQDLPFAKLFQDLQMDLSRPPFQVMFNWLDWQDQACCLDQAIQLPELTLEVTSASEFDLECDVDWTLFAIHHSRGIRLVMAYNSALFEAQSAVELLKDFESLLRQIGADPDQPIDDYLSNLKAA